MNITTLQKCVEELKKENPNISYVLGMLETVIEMNGVQVPLPQYSYPYIPNPITNPTWVVNSGANTQPLSDEEITAQKYAGGTIGAIS